MPPDGQVHLTRHPGTTHHSRGPARAILAASTSTDRTSLCTLRGEGRETAKAATVDLVPTRGHPIQRGSSYDFGLVDSVVVITPCSKELSSNRGGKRFNSEFVCRGYQDARANGSKRYPWILLIANQANEHQASISNRAGLTRFELLPGSQVQLTRHDLR